MASLSYSTYIDVRLSTTYGTGKVEHANYGPAALNHPRIEALLRAFSALLGESYRVGESDFYHGLYHRDGLSWRRRTTAFRT